MPDAGTIDRSPPPGRGLKLAVTGKGGSGKTMLTAIMTGLLARRENLRILAIDADSAVNLPYALGMRVGTTVSDMRRNLIEDPEARAEIENKHIRNVMAESLEIGGGFDLLVMGRPEGPGCYCSVNDLLRYGIERLSQDYDMTLVDCEAGPEQVNRRVVRGVDVLIIVTDTSIRGVQVTGSIAEVVRQDETMGFTRTGLVINRFKGDDTLIAERAGQLGLQILGRIPEDDRVAEYDAVGRPLVDLPASAPSVIAVREILGRLAP
jgi:CO dehydrogenase maturation factor